MFNWSNADAPILVKLPFEIYWGATGFITLVLVIGLLVFHHIKSNQIKSEQGPTNIGGEASGSQVQARPLQSLHVNNRASIGGGMV